MSMKIEKVSQANVCRRRSLQWGKVRSVWTTSYATYDAAAHHSGSRPASNPVAVTVTPDYDLGTPGVGDQHPASAPGPYVLCWGHSPTTDPATYGADEFKVPPIPRSLPGILRQTAVRVSGSDTEQETACPPRLLGK